MAEAQQQRQHPTWQTDFPPEEFAARRAKVLEAIGEEAVAVLQGAPPVRGFELFRQSNELYYLCGVDVPQCYLLIDGREGKTTLFMRLQDPGEARSEGESLAALPPEEIAAIIGVDAVARPEDLSESVGDARTVYSPLSPAVWGAGSRGGSTHHRQLVAADPWDSQLPRETRFLGLLQARRPRIEIENLTPILDRLRAVKSPREIALLRRAARLTGLGLMEACRSTEPGVVEYQLAALAAFVFLVNGAQGDGYRPIAASGANIWHGHYNRNNCALADGDLVLFDYAPACGGYTSDIGRMWPVNGTYSPLQRELYGLIVEYHKALLERIRPGVMADDIHAEAAEAMAPVIDATPFSKPIYAEAARRMLEFKGHLSHPVGLSVHDTGRYRDRPLEPGVVFTVDPQMWIPEEKRYIRCEDTVAVTADGIENLTGFAPLELDDMEALYREPGLLQSLCEKGLLL